MIETHSPNQRRSTTNWRPSKEEQLWPAGAAVAGWVDLKCSDALLHLSRAGDVFHSTDRVRPDQDIAGGSALLKTRGTRWHFAFHALCHTAQAVCRCSAWPTRGPETVV